MTTASPDATCGYINAISSAPFSCTAGYCGFDPLNSAVGCCASTLPGANGASLTDCTFQTICYSSTEVDLNADYITDDLALLCTDATAPYCAKYTFTDVSSAALFCNDVDTVINVARTYSGQEDANTVEATFGPSARPAAGTTSVKAATTTSGGSTVAKTTGGGSTPTTKAANGFGGAQNPFSKTQQSGGGTAAPTSTTGAASCVGAAQGWRWKVGGLVGAMMLVGGLL